MATRSVTGAALRCSGSSARSSAASTSARTSVGARTLHSTSQIHAQKQPERSRNKPTTNTVFQASPLSPSPTPAAEAPSHSAATVSFVKSFAKLLGYNSRTSTAIRVSSDLYDTCGNMAEKDAAFWYGECSLPRTYQTWFQITSLYVWLLLVRFRSLPTPEIATAYSQELINHFFIDAESRMRERFGVQTARLVKNYMRDAHQQQRGAVLGLDEALASGEDAVLAAALWRNLWGQGWGNVGGVKRKVKGIDKTLKGEDDSEEGLPELARDAALSELSSQSPYRRNDDKEELDPHSPSSSESQAYHTSDPEFQAFEYPQHLAQLTRFVRRDLIRLAKLSDQDVMAGRGATGSLSDFSKV